MGRLASDGKDALLVTKLKVLLRKAFDKPDDEKGHTPPPIASYDNFVKLLDVDDPVAQRAIEILAEDVFKVARRRKRTIDTARQSQPSLSSLPTRNPWSLTALDRDEHEERPETEVARNLREALEAAEHMRQNRGREMEEYDAIIADAQRRVASPLPIHASATNDQADNDDAVAADSWESFYATHDSSTTAPWRRNLRNFNNAPSTTIFDSQDWPDLNSSVSASASSGARQLAWATEGNPSSNRRLNRSRRRIQESDTESEADDVTGGWGDGFMPAGWQDPQEPETIATISHRPARAVTQDEHRRMLNVDRALSRAQDSRDLPSSSSYTTSSLANRALQPSSAAVRHAVIERIERRRRERNEAEADAAQRQLEFERAMLSAGWEARARTSDRAAAGAAAEEAENRDSAGTEIPPSVFHAPSTSSIRASLARNDSSSGIRRSRPLPNSFTSSSSASAAVAITPRTDSSLFNADSPDPSGSSLSTAATADTRTLRDSYDLVSGRYGLDSVIVPSSTSSLQRNTSIRRSGFHASPHSLRRASSFSSTFPRTAQNPLSVSAPASSSSLTGTASRAPTHAARDDFEAFSSRARRAAREAREASSEGGEHNTQANSASVPQGEPEWTGQTPGSRAISPVYGDDGRQLTPHELLRIAIAEDRANARAGATAGAGVGEGDAENVSELLGSSSSAAALGSSNSADDPTRYLRPPGAPIISRRQYPIGRSPSFTTTRQVADGESSQSQPIVIRWPSATVPEASIEIHDTRADTADQLLSLPEFLGELP